MLCCHQPFGGKHGELVCVAASGYNCLDMDIVSMDREREGVGWGGGNGGRGGWGYARVGGVKYGSRKLAWRSHSGGVRRRREKKSGWTARREKIVYEAFHPAKPERASERAAEQAGGEGGGGKLDGEVSQGERREEYMD